MCDAIFVYKEENINEILIDNSPVSIQPKFTEGQSGYNCVYLPFLDPLREQGGRWTEHRQRHRAR